MPATKGENGQPAKRKRASSDKRTVKRVRSESSDEDGQAQILLLESEIFESKKNYNNIVKLVRIMKLENQDADDSVVAAITLCRVFTRLMVAGEMTKRKDTAEKDTVVIRWLKERYTEYKLGLVALLREESSASTALTLCMRLLQTEGQHLHSSSEYNFPAAFLAEIVHGVVIPGSDGSVRLKFSEKFVEEYDDIRFYTLEALESVFCPSIYSRY
jgi:U3 small nucleolar RNA-associated protein 19